VTIFVALCGLLVAAALGLLLPPLMRKSAARSVTPGSASNALVYAEQLAELDAELRTGSISRGQWTASREEIERRALEEAGQGREAASRSGAAVAATAIGAALPLAALTFYILIGSPQALDPVRGAPAASDPQAPTVEQAKRMVEKLAARLASERSDTEGWIMLGRAQAVLGRYPEAAAAYATAAVQRPNDARVLADYAEALAMARGRDFSGEPEKLIARALKADGKNIKALTLAGTRAFQREDYRGAVRYWQRILPLAPEGSEFAKSVRAGIVEAERKLATKARSGAKPHPGDAARKP
jgi:cytochrome c-type biogenesis protein CcmH